MAEPAEVVLYLAIGLAIGFMLLFLVIQPRINKRAERLFEQRKMEIDSQFHAQYTTELEAWKAQYLLQNQGEVETRVKDEVAKALKGSRNTLKGRINEQLAPIFPEFTSKYVAADARFLGTPIDFVIFKNLSTLSGADPQPLDIEFVEVKTGKSNLTSAERAVRDAIDSHRVKFEVLRIEMPEVNISDIETRQVTEQNKDGLTQ